MADRSFLAWPFFDERHRALAATLDAWTAGEIEPLAHDESDVDALSRRFVALLGDAGWLRYCVPKAQGGHFEKLDVRSLCLVR
jgi:acyl-CoA dehydrogenase